MNLIYFAFKYRYRFKDLNNFLKSRIYGKYILLNLAALNYGDKLGKYEVKLFLINI